MSVLNLDAAVQAFADVMELDVSLVMRKLTIDVHTGITKRTPVDTGRARASWQIGIGEPDESVPPPITSAPRRNRRNPRLQTAPTNTTPAPDVVQITGKEPVFVTSSVEYVQYLEEGTSQQAPAGMVAVTLREVEAEIEQYMKGLAGTNNA